MGVFPFGRIPSVTVFLTFLIVSSSSSRDSIDPVTLDSSTQPFESRIILQKEMLIDDGAYESPRFQAPKESGVEWMFVFGTMAHALIKTKQIGLQLVDLPKFSSYAVVSVNCSFASKPKGTYVNTPVTKEKLILPISIPENPLQLAFFADPSSIMEISLDCYIAGLINVNTIMAKNVHQNVNEMTPRERRLECFGKSQLSPFPLPKSANGIGIVTLKAEMKSFPCHRSILRKQAPNLVPYRPTISGKYQFDFGDEINALELEDVINFLYFGKAKHANQTCPKLVSIAKKYQIHCLDVFCVETGNPGTDNAILSGGK